MRFSRENDRLKELVRGQKDLREATKEIDCVNNEYSEGCNCDGPVGIFKTTCVPGSNLHPDDIKHNTWNNKHLKKYIIDDLRDRDKKKNQKVPDTYYPTALDRFL